MGAPAEPSPQVKFKRPCSDCPFRRRSTPGWCGDSEPQWFVDSALADSAEYGMAPCHQTVDYTHEDWKQELGEAAVCAGALIFARNLAKLPRDAERAEAVRQVEADHTEVFSSPQQFLEHHEDPQGMRSWEKFPSKRSSRSRRAE